LSDRRFYHVNFALFNKCNPSSIFIEICKWRFKRNMYFGIHWYKYNSKFSVWPHTILIFQYSNLMGAVVVVIVWWVAVHLPTQSVHITTNVASSHPDHGEVYSIQHYVIKFVNDLWQVGGCLRVLMFPQPIKLTSTI